MVSLSSVGLYFHHHSYTNSWWGPWLRLSYPTERATCNLRKIQRPLGCLWTMNDRERDGGDRVSHDTRPHLSPDHTCCPKSICRGKDSYGPGVRRDRTDSHTAAVQVRSGVREVVVWVSCAEGLNITNRTRTLLSSSDAASFPHTQSTCCLVAHPYHGVTKIFLIYNYDLELGKHGS